jgi:hypothetical protein
MEAVSAAPVLTPGDEERDGQHPEADFLIDSMAALADAALKPAPRPAGVGIVLRKRKRVKLAHPPRILAALQPAAAHEVLEHDLLHPRHREAAGVHAG